MACSNLTTTLPMLGCCGEPPIDAVQAILVRFDIDWEGAFNCFSLTPRSAFEACWTSKVISALAQCAAALGSVQWNEDSAIVPTSQGDYLLEDFDGGLSANGTPQASVRVGNFTIGFTSGIVTLDEDASIIGRGGNSGESGYDVNNNDFPLVWAFASHERFPTATEACKRKLLTVTGQNSVILSQEHLGSSLTFLAYPDTLQSVFYDVDTLPDGSTAKDFKTAKNITSILGPDVC